MNPTFSIIIPTFGKKCSDLLIPCLESIIKYTDLSSVEVIVVANGCIDQTKEYVTYLSSIHPEFKLLWFDDGIGYTRATNEGIKISKGEYLILLNNDTVLLEQEKNLWLNLLIRPFLNQENVGITGPMKETCPYAGREFILFFCAAMSRKLIDKIGLLDEIFSPGYGEDCDMAARAQDAGFKIIQVPDDNSRDFYDKNKRTGNFPLWHIGNESFKNWIGGEDLLRKNNNILKERYYKSDNRIENALLIDGWMSEKELSFLADIAEKSKIFIEVGSWFGKSSKAIIQNLPDDGKLYCIDTFSGSIGEDHNHGSSKLLNGHYALFQFMKNHWLDINNGKLIVIRMDSVTAAKFLLEQKIVADAIFLDGSHDFESVRNDIEAWLPIIKTDGTGIMLGHDYYK